MSLFACLESAYTKGQRRLPLREVTPPGYEPVVKALKRGGKVDNAYAVAWSMKNKGIKPKKKTKTDEGGPGSGRRPLSAQARNKLVALTMQHAKDLTGIGVHPDKAHAMAKKQLGDALARAARGPK